MELTKFIAFLAAVLPVAYGAPTQAAENLHPEIVAAMKRDLGLDAEQAHARVARDIAAAETIETLKAATGSAFAGAWTSEDGETLNVAVTDEALAADITAAGATPVIVTNSASKLEEAKAALDSIDIDQPTTLAATESADATGIAAYYVDVAANKLVLEALSGSTAHAEALAAQVGLAAGEFEVRTVEDMPTTLATIRGGDAYLINRAARCSIGFTVTTGFVSAGHCGTTGNTATTSSGAALGTFSGSVFPGSADMSYIRAASGSTLQGVVYGYGGSNIAVTGSTASAAGASICRSGSTTGVYCGTVRALGATVNYAEGRVTGLTQTNVCAEPGDSGGSFYTGGQAQGVTSGGSGNCNSGGTTYFQPVNEILSTYGLTLVRG
ncbi:trypsin [Diaporthe helianthi]|uniref:Trypsin n=1 Tax=Diaporthe helianthi TaxID=158607 RepID=A0A2P5HTX7_DIAHE|nr:trypsin [Diaporthe helianthi]